MYSRRSSSIRTTKRGRNDISFPEPSLSSLIEQRILEIYRYRQWHLTGPLQASKCHLAAMSSGCSVQIAHACADYATEAKLHLG